MFSTMGQLLNGKQLTATRARQMTISANCDVVVLTDISAVDIAAKVSLLLGLPVSNLTDLQSNYSSLIRITVLKQLLPSWNNETQSKLHAIEQTVKVVHSSTHFPYVG